MRYTITAFHSLPLWTPRLRVSYHRAGICIVPVSHEFVTLSGNIAPVYFSIACFQLFQYPVLRKSFGHISRHTGRQTIKVLLRFHAHISLPSAQQFQWAASFQFRGRCSASCCRGFIVLSP